MPKHIVTVPDGHPKYGPTALFASLRSAPAVLAGGLVFVSGQFGLRPDGSVPVSSVEQATRAFDRLGVVLEAAGCSFDDLVELTSYHVDLDLHLVEFMQVKDRYLKDNLPAWTMLGVHSMARAGLTVQIKAVAAARV